jgi:hypothetical protein
MKRLIVAGVTFIVASLTVVGSAWAETTKICVPETPSKPVLSASVKNECPTTGATNYKTETLPDTAELEALDQILPHVKYVENGVDSKPTIQFSGVNVQVVNGEGKTASTNGEGNLVLGYDENESARNQNGSHNLVLGSEQAFTSYAGIIGGHDNVIAAPFASVLSGFEDDASAEDAVVVTGEADNALGKYAGVFTGNGNLAEGLGSVIVGGDNSAAGTEGAILGGSVNFASGDAASIVGGEFNGAEGTVSSVAGGSENVATGEGSSISGGFGNKAEGRFSSIFGGKTLTAKREYQAIP